MNKGVEYVSDHPYSSVQIPKMLRYFLHEATRSSQATADTIAYQSHARTIHSKRNS